MNLRKRLIVTYLFIALVPLSFVALLSYTSMREALLAVQQGDLEASADAKVGMIRGHFDDLREDAAIMAERTVIKDFYEAARIGPESGGPGIDLARSVLDEQVGVLSEQMHDVKRFVLLDAAGYVVYSTDPAILGSSASTAFREVGESAFLEGSEGVSFSDIYRNPSDSEADIAVSAPVRDRAGGLLGVIVLDIGTKRLVDIVRSGIGSGRTTETVLARRVSGGGKSSGYPYDASGDSVAYLTPLNADKDAALKRVVKIGEDLAVPIQQAVQGRDGSGTATDYRGEQTLSVWRYMPENRLGLVVKTDMDELLVPARKYLAAILLFALVALLSIIQMTWIMAGSIANPVTELTEIVKRVGKGEMDVSFSEKLSSSDDEVGILAKAFAASTAAVRDSYKNMERLVAERTEKLAKSEAESKKNLEETKKLNEETQRLNRLMVGRETKMIELKKRIEELEAMIPKR